jgi:hypothetical protein
MAKKDEYRPPPLSDNNMTYPLGFSSYGHFTKEVHPFLAALYKLDRSATIAIMGSSIQGFKFRKKKGKGLWFDENSDYDIAICSQKIYARMEEDHPGYVYNGGHRTHGIPHSLDKDIDGLYKFTEKWPRRVHITVYRSMTFFIDFSLLTLFVEVNTKARICNTYLIGENVMTGESVGDRRSFLQKYGELPRLIPSDQTCSVQLNQCLKQKLLLEESVAKFNQLRDNTESLIDNLTKNPDLKSTLTEYKNVQKEIDNLIETLSSHTTPINALPNDTDYSGTIDSVADIIDISDTDYSSDTPIVNRFPSKDIKSKNHQTPEKFQKNLQKRHLDQKIVSHLGTDNSLDKRPNNHSNAPMKISPKFAHTNPQLSNTHGKSHYPTQTKSQPTVHLTPSKNTSTAYVKNKHITSVKNHHTTTFAENAPTASVKNHHTTTFAENAPTASVTDTTTSATSQNMRKTHPKIMNGSSNESNTIKHIISDETNLKEQITKELTVSLAKELKELLAKELSQYFAKECTDSDNSYPCFKLVHSKNASQEASI